MNNASAVVSALTTDLSPTQAPQNTGRASEAQPDTNSGLNYCAQSAPRGALATVIVFSAILLCLCIVLYLIVPAFGIASLMTTSAVWAVIAVLVLRSLKFHPHNTFGHANAVTTARAVSTAVLAGFIPIAADVSSPGFLWLIAIAATITLCMDGLDGYLARKTGLSSAFGARFDMETDALLALVITLFLWQSGKLGPWVLWLGLMRYAFLLAAIWLEPLKGELYPSLRRKLVCVIQVGALCFMLCPWLSAAQATLIGLLALVSLTYSFATDVVWLYRQHGNEGKASAM